MTAGSGNGSGSEDGSRKGNGKRRDSDPLPSPGPGSFYKPFNPYSHLRGANTPEITGTRFKLVRDRADQFRINRDAKRMVDGEGWSPPEPGTSLQDSIDNPPPPVKYVVAGLLPEGISVLAAQFKSGKTTLGIDLAACLAAKEDFLGYFEVDDLEGNVGYWNLEVGEPQMFEWQRMRVTGTGRRTASRIFTAHLRGKLVDLEQERAAEWTFNWLQERRIDVWIIDPLGRLLAEENDPAAFSRWFRQLERITTEAQVRATLIMHHAGHPAPGQEDSTPRARGASSIMGNTDANVAYRHGGNLGAAPAGSLRYLSAFGRGVDIPGLTLDYDKETGRLWVVSDNPEDRAESRAAVRAAEKEERKAAREAERKERKETLAAEALALILLKYGVSRVNYSTLAAELNVSSDMKSVYIRAAVESGNIIREAEGTGKPTWFSLPEG